MSSRISVVIPCYNYGQYLPEAVQSCLRQTVSPHQVLIVDDGSTDDTAAVARQFGHRVEYLWKRNGGLSSARNEGVAHVTGDYVVFLDADDLLADTYLERCAEVLGSVPRDIAFVYTPVRYFGRRSGVSRTSPYSIRTLRYSNYVNASAMIRSDVLRRFSYAEDLSSLEDFDFYLTLAEHGFRGMRIKEPLLLYRKHDSMSDAMKDQWLLLHQRIIRRHPSLYPWHVRANMAVFDLVARVPRLDQALWIARNMVREVPEVAQSIWGARAAKRES
jgi:glycosyltransferase involved in cell wall biosynthesis